MAETGSLAMLRQLNRLVDDQRAAQVSDRELLQRFATTREEAAFATLVQRHAGVVFGVCQRILQQQQDAEDAFQAVFLVLARKAGSSGWQPTIGSWLYQTAYRVALKLRGRRAQQATNAAKYAATRTPPMADEPPANEWLALLDDEMQRLPERYRRPLLLCYVMGKSQDEAAQELGWTLGALRGRLFRGRELLRERLTKRRPALAAIVLPLTLASSYALPLPRAFLDRTVSAMTRLATRQDYAGLVSATTVNLTQRTLQAMFLTRCKYFALAFGVGLVGVGFVVRPVQAEVPSATPADKTEPAKADAAGHPRQFPHIDGVHGFIEKVTTTGPATLTVALEENRKVRLAFDMAKNATVHVAGQKAAFADLRVGHEVILTMADDLRTIAHIDATVKREEVPLQKVDVAQRQLTVLDDDDDKKQTNTLTIADNVPIYIDGYLDTLTTLAECQEVCLEYGVDGKTVARISAKWERDSDLQATITALTAASGDVTFRVNVDDGDDYTMTLRCTATTRLSVAGQKVTVADLQVGQRALLRLEGKETLLVLRAEPKSDKKDDDE